MEYLLTSTSGRIEETVENTVFKKYSELDIRTLSSPEEFDEKFRNFYKPWLSEGVNHQIFNGFIAREFPDKLEGYFININTIEELERLKESIGYDLIITTAFNNQTIPCIEIYNNWRE